MVGGVSFSELHYFVYMRVKGLATPDTIQQHRVNLILGLSFFSLCLHFGLRFWLRGGNFKWLNFILIISNKYVT